MRSWVFGLCLAAVAAGGVYFVAIGGSSTHCGPCVACKCPASAGESDSSTVVEVVDVAAALAKPAAPSEERFVSFDEPPLAKPFANKAPAIIQATFEEPASLVEVAPMPRAVSGIRGSVGLGNFSALDRQAGEAEGFPGSVVEVAPQPRTVGADSDPMPLASPGSPF